ncbi:hypothetical protein HDU82_005021 [Entophlyctis luteolus]|nr:hypothetical protein HDU82_005021 [Entophlyctis luteolus]
MSHPSPPQFSCAADFLQCLELARRPLPTAVFEEYLRAQEPSFVALLDSFHNPTAASRKKFDAAKVKDSERANVLAFSALASLDEMQSLDIVKAHIVQELKVRGSNAVDVQDSMKQLFDMDSLLSFYFRERTASLTRISALIRASHNVDHPYYEVIARVIPGILANGDFLKNVKTQLSARFKARVPPHLERQSRRALLWATQCVQEQKALLEILFSVYYDEVQCEPEEAVKIISLIEESKFALEQPNAPVFDQAARSLWKDVAHLSVMVCLTVLNIEQLLPVENDQDIDIPFSKYHDEVYAVTMLMAKYLAVNSPSEAAVVSPLLLTWGVVLQKLHTVDKVVSKFKENEIVVMTASNKFVQAADFVGVFEHIRDCLKHYAESDSQNHPNMTAYRSVLKGLLNLFITSYNLEESQKFDVFVDCFSYLFRNSYELCQQFWIQDYPLNDRRSILDAARSRFPFEQRPLIKLLASLSSDNQTAGYVIEYLKAVQTFSGYFEESDIQIVSGTPKLSRDYVMARGPSSKIIMVAPAGTAANILSMNPPVFQLIFPYSAFHFFISQLDLFLEKPLLDPQTLTSSVTISNESLVDWMHLLNNVIQHADPESLILLFQHLCNFEVCEEARFQPADFAKMICRVLVRAFSTLSSTTDLLTASMKTLSLLLPSQGSEIWYLLLGEFGSGSGANAKRCLQQRILPYEKTIGEYDVTLAFLDLVEAVLNESRSKSEGDLGAARQLEAVQADILTSCVDFIQTHIFATYNSWRYARVSDKLDIGLKILRIFNSVLQDFTPSTKNSPLSEVRNLVISSYLDSSLHQINPVLEILGTGNATPIIFSNLERFHEKTSLEASIAEVLLFVQLLLVERRCSGKTSTLLEHAIMDRSVPVLEVGNGDVRETKELVHVIASYVLILLCAVASEWKPHPPSFVGYFGSEATKIVSQIIELASDDSFDTATDNESVLIGTKESIQRASFDFVSIVMQNQPGLGTLFINSADSETSNTVSQRRTVTVSSPKNSILRAINIVISNWSEFLNKRATVLPAALHLVSVLWRTGPEHQHAMHTLRTATPGFWSCLYAVFDAELEGAGDGHVQQFCLDTSKNHVLRIFATEVFYGGGVSKAPAAEWIAKTVKIVADTRDLGRRFDEVVKDLPVAEAQKCLHHVLSDVVDFKVNLDAYIKPWINQDNIFFIEFGQDFVYDVERLLVTESSAFKKIGDANAQDVLNGLRKLNLALSKSKIDGGWLRNAVCLLKVCTIRLGANSWFGGETPLGQCEALLGVCKVICDTLATIDFFTSKRLEMCVELSEVLVLFISIWCKTSEELSVSDSKSATGIVMDFATSFQNCIFNSEFQGLLFSQESDVAHAYYGQVWSVALIAIKVFSLISARAGDSKYTDSTRRFCVDIIPHAIRPLEQLLGMSLSKSYGGESEHSAVLMAILMEALIYISEFPAAIADMIPSITNSNLIPLLQNVVKSVGMQRNPANADSLMSPVSDSEFLTADSCLRLLLLLARIPGLAEKLAEIGLIASFCDSPISLSICEGSSIGAYIGQERNVVHELWCLMLRVIGTSVLSVRRVHPATVGFLRLHWNQVLTTFGAPFETMLNTARLEEIEAFSEIFYALIWLGKLPEFENNIIDGEFLQSCRDILVNTLRQAVYMLRHPSMLAKMSVFMNQESIEGVTSANESEFRILFEKHIKSRVVLIVRNILGFLCVSFDVGSCLSIGDFSSVAAEGLSLSTLFECLTFCTDAISAKKSIVPEKSSQDKVYQRGFATENITLMVSQVSSLIVCHVMASATGEEGRREALDNLQQTKTALEMAQRGEAATAECAREVAWLLERI